jgi:hypothetical protein
MPRQGYTLPGISAVRLPSVSLETDGKKEEKEK